MPLYPVYAGLPMTQTGARGPYAPHPTYVFQYRFPQFAVTPQVQQNLLRPTGKGCGPQGSNEECGAATYPLAQFNPVQQIGRLSGRLGGLGGLFGLGEALPSAPDVPPPNPFGPVSDVSKQLSTEEIVASAVWGAASLLGTALGAYHGYRRNNSVGWGVWWAVMGGLFPIVTVPVAIAQGFGKRSR